MEERRPTPNGLVDKENSQSTDEQPNAPGHRGAHTTDAFTAFRRNHLMTQKNETVLRYNGKPPANLLPEIPGAPHDDDSKDSGPPQLNN